MGNRKRSTDITPTKTTTTTTLLAAAVALLFASQATALDFTVHGYDLGEQIQTTSGRTVWTAELTVSLETIADEVASFCVDLDTYIGVATYQVHDVLDAFSDPSPTGEAARDLAWAGHVMDNYGHNIDLLVGGGLTRDHVITGVQAAIWEGIYLGDTIERDSLSAGAQTVFDMIMQSGLPILDGPSIVVDLANNQDQIISAAVPEPSAALVFGLGTVVVGTFTRRRVN